MITFIRNFFHTPVITAQGNIYNYGITVIFFVECFHSKAIFNYHHSIFLKKMGFRELLEDPKETIRKKLLTCLIPICSRRALKFPLPTTWQNRQTLDGFYLQKELLMT